MLWSLSWKNVWRNKVRSTVVIIAVTLGVFAGIFIMAFTNGMVEARIKTIINTEISHIQIHKPGFQENNDFSLRIENADSLLRLIQKTRDVAAVSKRLVVSSLAASAETNTGVKISGIIPEEEKRITDIHTRITEGKYFEGIDRNPIVIGQKLAEKLKVSLNKKIIITLRDVNMNITGGAFRIAGIYKTDNDLFDEANVFVRYSDLARLTGLKGTEAHEIAILLDNNKSTGSVKKELQHKFPNLLVQDWMEISPEAGYLVSAMDQYMAVFIIIIMLALCFGIINTMLMVVLERVHELGMLMAVGMSKLRVFTMIMLETVYLSLTGGFLGIILGSLICKHLERVGLDLYFWKDVYSSFGYSSFIYPVVNFKLIVFTGVMVILMGIISAIYPAVKALKLNPAEATRAE
jgi:ABC-type lipoprotein release transport system permease subunit